MQYIIRATAAKIINKDESPDKRWNAKKRRRIAIWEGIIKGIKRVWTCLKGNNCEKNTRKSNTTAVKSWKQRITAVLDCRQVHAQKIHTIKLILSSEFQITSNIDCYAADFHHYTATHIYHRNVNSIVELLPLYFH